MEDADVKPKAAIYIVASQEEANKLGTFFTNTRPYSPGVKILLWEFWWTGEFTAQMFDSVRISPKVWEIKMSPREKEEFEKFTGAHKVPRNAAV